VVVLSADLTDSTRAGYVRDEFPKRFIDVGVAEQNMMGLAAGLAATGKIPYACSFACFSPARNWDQLRVSVCYSNLNVNILGSHAGLVTGKDGASHQALEDIAITRCLPNMTVLVPCDTVEAKKCGIVAARIKGPVYIRVGREKVPIITNHKTSFKVGKAEVFRKGRDACIIACGIMVYKALVAAEELKKQGINVKVINNHTIKPIDKKTIIKAAKKTRAIVTAEEHQLMGGMGSAVAEVLSAYPVPIKMVGVNDTFGESGKPDELLEKYCLTVKDIVKAVKEVIKLKSK